MKKFLLLTILLSTMTSANAASWYERGQIYGNVCRIGFIFTVYPRSMGQPIGTNCPIRNDFGIIIGEGIASEY